MKTYYISRSSTPNLTTCIRARTPLGARAAFMRSIGYPCRLSPATGMPIFRGTQQWCDMATDVWARLVVQVPLRTGRNPPLGPLQ